MQEPDPSLLIPFAEPHNLNTSWSLPDCTVSTSVPEVSLASGAFPEPHPLDGDLAGVDELPLAGTFELECEANFALFLILGKSAKKTQ